MWDVILKLCVVSDSATTSNFRATALEMTIKAVFVSEVVNFVDVHPLITFGKFNLKLTQWFLSYFANNETGLTPEVNVKV